MTCISVFNFSISLIALWIFPIWYGLLTFQGTIVESFQRSTTREFLHSSFSPDLPALDTQVPWSVVFFLIIHAHQTSDALVGPIMHWISFTLCTFMLITFSFTIWNILLFHGQVPFLWATWSTAWFVILQDALLADKVVIWVGYLKPSPPRHSDITCQSLLKIQTLQLPICVRFLIFANKRIQVPKYLLIFAFHY